jgi:glycosyltransferase involved in cell wall biosynthesis
MEILLFPSTVEPVGVAVHVLNLACLLRDAGMRVAVLCPGEGWLVDELEAEGLEYQVIRISFRPADSLRSSLAVYRFLRAQKDLSVVHLHGRFPTLLSLPSMLCLHRPAFVATVHQFAVEATGVAGWKSALESLVLTRFIRRICCVSGALRGDVLRRIGARRADKVVVIRNWIRALDASGGSQDSGYPTPARPDPASPAPAAGTARGPVRIVGVGRLSVEKGFDVLVDAVRLLVEGGRAVMCDIHGDGPERLRLAEQIGRCGLDDAVRLRGACGRIRRLLPGYDLLVVPSRSESFGLVSLEAYEARIPVVASGVPGLSEVVHDLDTGLLFPPGDAEALARCITTLTEDPALRESLVQAGAAFVKAFYPTDQLAADFLRFYGLRGRAS